MKEFLEREDVKNILLPSPGARVFVRDIQPLVTTEDASLGLLPLGLSLRCSISVVPSSGRDDATQFLKTGKPWWLYGVSRVGGGALSR